jgi:hypothetical protein
MAAHVTIGGVDYNVVFDPPGETANILQLTAGTDPSTLKFYGVLEGDSVPDRVITYANLVSLLFPKASVRVGSHSVTVGANTIMFTVGGVNTPFSVTTYAFFQSKEAILGLSDFVQYVDRITFNAIDAGTMPYIAILNT